VITDILIEPVGRTFEVAEVEAFVESLPHAARDAIAPTIFMVAYDADSLDDAREARRADPKRYPTSVILIDVTAQRIDIAFRTQFTAPARRLVDWLRGRYELKIMDEAFTDLTAESRDLDFLFGSEP